MGGYRFAIQAGSVPPGCRLEDVRWSLTALAPSRRTRCGTFVASDGAHVPYRLWLPPKPRAAVVLLHGFFDYSGAFDAIGPRLARMRLAALAFDQRGFGATPSRGNWAGVERMATDVADAAAFVRTRVAADLPLFLVGESMGGAVAVHAAAAKPELAPSGLVLVAPGALASSLRRSLYGWIIFLFRAIAGKAEFVIERRSSEGLSPAAAIRLLGDPLVMRSTNADMLEGVIALAHSAVERAGNVRVPTLTMMGEKDDLLHHLAVRRLHENLAGPKCWAEIADGPHLLLHWERGKDVLRAARRWIDQQIS